MNRVVAITGSTGSGKSTVSLALAKKIPKCAFVEVDHVKHMIISGFYNDKKSDGTEVWLYSEWKLVGETIGLIGKNFLNNGFSVVICGYMHEDGWQALEGKLKIDSKFMLHPAKEVIKIRDMERDEKYFMGHQAIQEHLDYLSLSSFDGFTKINSTDQTVDETVDYILGLIQ